MAANTKNSNLESLAKRSSSVPQECSTYGIFQIIIRGKEETARKPPYAHMQPFRISLTAAKLDCLASWLSTARTVIYQHIWWL